MNLNELYQMLLKIAEGELHVPQEEFNKVEPLIEKLNVSCEANFGTGEIGYKPVVGYTIRPR